MTARVVCALVVAVVFPTTGASVAWSAPPPPTVSVTSPAAGSTVKGTVAISATAVAGAGDYISSISFYDGVNSIGSGSCQSQTTCSLSINWKATGLSGPHSLTARAYSGASLSTTSAVVGVNVESPPPTVTITSPAAGATVAGSILITASAATDPSQDDYPTSISFYDGVNSIGSVSCQAQSTCEGSVRRNATGLTGEHTFTARVYTNRSRTVTSPPTTVLIVSPAPTVSITSPTKGASLRRRITVKVTGHTDPTQVDYPTSIAVFDGTSSIGSVTCQGQPTCSGSVLWDARRLSGRHKLTAVIYTNTSRSRTSTPITVGVAVKRKVVPRCTLSRSTAKIGQIVRGTCTISGAPSGTRAAIQFRSDGRWRTAVSGRVGSGGKLSFKLKGARRRTFDLFVLVSSSSRSASARAHIGRLRIG